MYPVLYVDVWVCLQCPTAQGSANTHVCVWVHTKCENTRAWGHKPLTGQHKSKRGQRDGLQAGPQQAPLVSLTTAPVCLLPPPHPLASVHRMPVALLRITSSCMTSSSELLPILYCLRLFWSIVNETLLQTPWNRRARRSEAESISDPSWAIGMWKGRGEKNQRPSHITKADTRRLPLTDHVTVHESVTLPWNKCFPKTATS